MSSPSAHTELLLSGKAKDQTNGAMLERFVQDTSAFQDRLVQISQGIAKPSIPNSSEKTSKLLQQLDRDLSNAY